MWAVLSKEEVPHLNIRAKVLETQPACGLLELVRLTPTEYTALCIYVLPTDAAWLRRLAAAANDLAAQLDAAGQVAAEDAEAARLVDKARAGSTEPVGYCDGTGPVGTLKYADDEPAASIPF